MSLGVHFALASKDLRKLRRFTQPEVVDDFIAEELEARYPLGERAFASDESWDAIHRALTDGQLAPERGPFPLAYAVLGGKRLATSAGSTACLVEPDRVKAVAVALAPLTREWFENRYRKLADTDYGGPFGEADATHAWLKLVGLRTFFEQAAKADRAVLFSVDA